MELQQIELNEEQFKANRFELVSRLADDLAHEIKNPLNAIVINLEVLRVRVTRGDEKGALERAAVIELEARRLHVLVDRMLQLLRPAREEASGLALDQVLEEILPLVEAQARIARNHFSSSCAAPVFVPVRRDVFKFAALNLFTAVHVRLGEGGGSLDIDCVADADFVRVNVRALPFDDAPALPAPDAAFDQAVQVAAGLLAPCGGRVLVEPDGAAILLPRGASV
ncbi:MAG: histidine kinase dimerization/phospho-acceptor domain-containing protein [Gemmatimonadota bacterium]